MLYKLYREADTIKHNPRKERLHSNSEVVVDYEKKEGSGPRKGIKWNFYNITSNFRLENVCCLI